MKTCSAISLSGGQGKTTVTFFLSLILARHGKRVLVVDADPQANLTFYLGVDIEANQPTLLEVLTGQVKPDEGIYETNHENLFLIPADRGLFKVTDFLASSGAGAFILKLRLQSVAKLFDYCLIDVQPSRSQICLTAVGASDFVVIPVEANVKGTNSLNDTLDFLAEQQGLTAFSGKILGVVPFRDRWVGNTQTLESRQNIEAMQQFAEGLTIFPSIRESEQFKRAIRQAQLPSDLKASDLEYPFEKLVEALNNA
jgi:chromosome partitioning protein